MPGATATCLEPTSHRYPSRIIEVSGDLEGVLGEVRGISTCQQVSEVDPVISTSDPYKVLI